MTECEGIMPARTLAKIYGGFAALGLVLTGWTAIKADVCTYADDMEIYMNASCSYALSSFSMPIAMSPFIVCICLSVVDAFSRGVFGD